jgi:prepilin-type N-terminal cleavage/methylation domain-containing protein
MMRYFLNRKIKAFTLIELVVTMVISSIVVMLAFTCYEITYKQYLNFRKSNNTVTQVILFNSLFKQDVLLSDLVSKTDDNDITLRMNDSVSVNYSFGSNYILRKYNELTPDTFPITSVTVKEQFQNNLVDENGLVDDITISGVVRGENVFFSCSKEYDADLLMKQEMNKRLNR